MLLRFYRYLFFFYKVVGVFNSIYFGDVGVGKDFIGYKGKFVWIIVCGFEDYVERFVKGSWFVFKWR